MKIKSPQGIYIFLALMSCIWTIMVVPIHYTQFKHRNLIAALKVQNDTMYSTIELEDAIADYERTARYISCYGNSREDLAILYVFIAEKALASKNLEAVDSHLSKALEATEAQLKCSPRDGKLWLNYAAIEIQRSGFNAKALGAYKISAQVAPREAWIVEQRLLFSLPFYPLFDKEALAIAKRDLKVLQNASTKRQQKIIKASKLNSMGALEQAFEYMAELSPSEKSY